MTRRCAKQPHDILNDSNLVCSLSAVFLYCQLLEARILTPLAVHSQSFNKMIDRRMAASPVDGLIVYPEGTLPLSSCICTCEHSTSHGSGLTSPHYTAGHRSTSTSSLPLKRGMLAYAYSRKVPVQVSRHVVCLLALVFILLAGLSCILYCRCCNASSVHDLPNAMLCVPKLPVLNNREP